MMSDIMGLLMNVVIFGAVFMVLRMLWKKFRGNRAGNAASYTEARRDIGGERMMDVTPQQSKQPGRVVDILPPAPQDDYDPKRTADRYRNR